METVKSILGFISGGSSRKKAAAASTGSAGGGSSSRSKRGVSNESVEEEDILCMNEVQHLTAHKDIVRSLVCVDVLGKKLQYLISSSDDTTICIWDAHTGRLIHTLRGHTMPVKCVLVIDNRPPTDKQPTSVPASAESDACAGGGEGEKEDDDGLASVARSLILISGSSDRSIRVWDIITGKCLQVLDKQNGSVFSLSAIPTATSHQHQQQQHVNHTTGGTPPLDSNGHKGPDSLDAPTVQLAPRVYKNVKRFCSGASDNDIQIWSITPDRGVVHSGKISSYDSGKESKKKTIITVINKPHASNPFIIIYYYYWFICVL